MDVDGETEEAASSAVTSDTGTDTGTDSPVDIGSRALEKQMKDDVLRKIQSKEYEVVKKEGRGVSSEAWVKFRLVRCARTKEFKNAVQCSLCKLIKLYQKGSSTSPLKKHVCHTVDQSFSSSLGSDSDLGRPQVPITTDMKTTFRDACVQMCTGDIRPFNIVQGNHFQSLIQTAIDLGAQHGRIEAKNLIPDPTTISRNVEKTAKEIRLGLSEKLREAIKNRRCAMTTDMWSEDFTETKYLTVTCHDFDDDWALNSQVLFTAKFPEESETAENIKKLLLAEFRKLRVCDEDLQKIVFVSDGGANIIKALSLLGVERLYCADHCLNVVLKRAFTLPLVDLDLLGEEANKVIEEAALAVSLIKTKKLDKNLAKVLKDIPVTRKSEGSRYYKQLYPPLECFLEKFEEVS